MVSKNSRQVLEIILSLIAIAVAGSILLKAISDIDTNYDVGWYHLPFAARIWGIVPADMYLGENLIEYRYAGFPLLAHFLQGLLWKVTGRIQATNLVGYLSLIVYFGFLKKLFRVPLYLSVIAIFTIPAVLTHAATSFVDLPGNIGVAIAVMLVYVLFRDSRLPSKEELLSLVLSAAAAANIKPQLQPLVLVIYWVAGIRLLWLYLKYRPSPQRRWWLTLLLTLLASGLIFATPIKNVALYGNPFYPIKIEVAGIVLNHRLTPDTYREGNRPQKWLRSILEIDTPKWSADQYNGGDQRYLDRAGGFFGSYVVFNLLLLFGLAMKEQWQNRKLVPDDQSFKGITALFTVLLMSLIPANFPQSHELRYFMFWMIVLVSLNLYLVSTWRASPQGWLQPKYLGLVCLLFMVVMAIKIDDYYLRPVFSQFEPYLRNTVKQELLAQMIPNERTCMISRHAIANPKSVPFAQIHNAFYYSAYFHPEIKYQYSIKAAVDPKDCGELQVIPPNIQDYL